MKKSILIISSLLLFIFICNAQTDSVKAINDSIINQHDSVIKSANTSQVVDSNSIATAPDTSKYALLYVYRPKNFVGSFISYKLRVSNGSNLEEPVGRVKNNSKFVVKLYNEGLTEIIAQTEAKTVIKLNVKFGSKYYLKCGVSVGAFVGRPALNLIFPEQGELDYDSL